MIKLSGLKLNDRNPRYIKDSQFDRLVKSIEKFPRMLELRPIVVDQHSTVVGGNMRYRALEHLGYVEVDESWIKRVEDFTEAELREFIIKDNLAFGDWDWDELANSWDEQDLTDWGLDFPDFALESGLDEEPKVEDEIEVEKLLEDVGKVESRVKPGEIWQLGRHKIACGDSTIESNVRALLGDRFDEVGMVWADPPFNTKIQQGRTASSWGVIEGDNLSDSEFNDFVKRLFSVTALFDTPLYICCHWKSYPVFFNNNSNIKALIIWVKNNFGLGNGYRPQHEFICFYGQFDSTTESNVWEISKDSSSEYKHPMQKPLALLERAFNNSSLPNDLIFDPFLGSAPSIIAAQNMDGDRTVYGFELSPDYCEVIIKRFEQFTGDTAKLIGSLSGTDIPTQSSPTPPQT